MMPMNRELFIAVYTTADNRIDTAVCNLNEIIALRASHQLINTKGPYHTLSLRELDYAETHRSSA